VTVTVLSSGDANCPYGGARFSVGTSNSYACNGAPGPMGPPGSTVSSDGGTLGGGFAEAGNEGYVFVGFTVGTYNGNLGGIQGAHAKCDAEYAGSHLCTDREYEVVGSAAPVPATGAWIDGARNISTSTPSATPRDRDTGYTCGSWKLTSSAYSASLLPTGEYQATTSSTACATIRPLACCRFPHLAWFRGFTTLTFNGNLGGIQGAHAKCAAQFAGSHFCTDREYEMAGSAAPVPSSGAWIDGARNISSSTPSATPRDRDTGYTCGSWKLTSSAYSGSLLATGEYQATTASAACGTVRPLACCSN
jgi:hypothetical protein